MRTLLFSFIFSVLLFSNTIYGQAIVAEPTFTQLAASLHDSSIVKHDTLLETTNYDSAMVCQKDTCYWSFKSRMDTTVTTKDSIVNSNVIISVTYSIFQANNDSLYVSLKSCTFDSFMQCRGSGAPFAPPLCWYELESYYAAPLSMQGDIATRPGNGKTLSAIFSSSKCDAEITACVVGSTDTISISINSLMMATKHQPMSVGAAAKEPACITVMESPTTMTFHFSVKISSACIYDIYGRLIAKIPVENNAAVWNKRLIARGRYFVATIINNKSVVKPFLIIR
jgi:hypothetical protein